MKKILFNMFIGLVSLFAAQVLFAFIMYAVTFISQDAIRDNMEKSADLLCENQVFFDIIEGVEASKIDRYADSITLNIAWNLNGDEHLKNALLCNFLTSDILNENINFKSAVTSDINEYQHTRQYMRYWHGSAALMRLMHLFMSLKDIYITNGIIILILAGLNIFIFARRKLYDCLVAFAVGLIATGTFFVPFSLEYTWVYIVMLAVTLAVSLVLTSGKKGNIGSKAIDPLKLDISVFIIFAGALIVNFLDFLTAETLTLTIPLLIMVRICSVKNHDKKVTIGYMIKSVLAWGIGYIVTWVSKWLISYFALKENVLPFITEHITERLGGEITGLDVSKAELLFGAIGRNITSLFPVGYGVPGIVGTVIILIVLAYVVFVHRKKGVDAHRIILYAMVGILPYIRYLVLHNHSYIHRFFTCRAQMVTVMAVILIVFEIIGDEKA